jgi:DNA-binding NtrC family response regulator
MLRVEGGLTKAIHVLIIDDDALIQNLSNLSLADRGMKIWSAYNTAEADQILAQKKIDVIVCDVWMAPENGLEYCARLQKRHVRTPIILISAQASPMVMQPTLESNLSSTYLIKPFSAQQLYQRIIETLASRSSPKAQPVTS